MLIYSAVNMNKFSKAMRLVAVNLIFLILLLSLLEVSFRIIGIPYDSKWIPDENAFARFDPELGWSYIPNKSTIHRADYLKVPVHFDKDGIRVPLPGFEFDKTAPSVLFIGGSFTMGHGLSYEEGFVGKFAAIKGLPYQVVNLGVQGFGSDQTLLVLKKHFHRFNAKIVIYTFIEDHIYRNGNFDRRILIPSAKFLGTKPLFDLDTNEKLYLARSPLLYKDYINSYLIDTIKMKIGGALGIFPPYPEKLTKAIIMEMKKYSEENGAHFVVIGWRWTDTDYNKLLRGLDVDVIDTMVNAPDNWNDTRLLGGLHPGAESSSHVVRILSNYLNKKNLGVPLEW